jgi:hypothetical protein
MYNHVQYEYIFTATNGAGDFSATATGIKSKPFFVGAVPMVIRSLNVLPLTSGADYSGAVIQIDVTNLASGSTASAVAACAMVATDKPGHVVFKDGLNVQVNPGQKVELRVSAAKTGTQQFAATMFVEPMWDNPRNRSTMRVTT